MGFSQSTITSVAPPIAHNGELILSWTSSSPPGTWFQVYVGTQLVWYGTARTTSIPAPPELARILIGTVDAADKAVDLAGELPAAPNNRALLSWEGGRFLDPFGRGNVAGFKVYAATPVGGFGDGGFGAGRFGSNTGFGGGGFGAGYFGGLPYVLGPALVDIPAYTGNTYTDGFGSGPFGAGGFGSAAGWYDWTSAPLLSGTWSFAVAAYDGAGNLGIIEVVSVVIAVPPPEPPPFPDRSRLHYLLEGFGNDGFGGGGFGAEIVRLNWNAPN